MGAISLNLSVQGTKPENNQETIQPKAQTSTLGVIVLIICSFSPISVGSKHSGDK